MVATAESLRPLGRLPQTAETIASRARAEKRSVGCKEAFWIVLIMSVVEPPACTDAGVNKHCAHVGRDEQAKPKVALLPVELVFSTTVAGCAGCGDGEIGVWRQKKCSRLKALEYRRRLDRGSP
jgi:hypothetical protein